MTWTFPAYNRPSTAVDPPHSPPYPDRSCGVASASDHAAPLTPGMNTPFMLPGPCPSHTIRKSPSASIATAGLYWSPVV